MNAIPLLLIVFALGYFVLIRPQKQRVRYHRDLHASIAVGDHVVTTCGIVGNVVAVNDDRMQLEVADGVVVEFLRLSISRRIEASVPFWGAAASDDEESGEEGEEYGEDEYAEEESAEGDAEAESAEGDAGGSGEEVAATDDAPAGDDPDVVGLDGSIEEGAIPAPGQDPH